MAYVWCLHCEEVHSKEKWIGKVKQGYRNSMLENEYGYCPNCGTSGFKDGWKWGTVVKNNKGYPRIPIEGERYPLYGNQ